MREFAFALEFDHGVHPVADLFVEADVRLRLVEAAITDGRVWRLDQLTGADAAVSAAMERLTDGCCNECLGERTCGGGASYDRLDDDAGTLLYTDRPLRRSCHSVARTVADSLGGGILARADWHDDRYRWRLLLPDEDGVGLLYDTLPARLRDGISFRFEHLRDPEGWPVGTPLPPEQRRAVEAAVERGFYETPRETSVTELAAALDLPRSTLSYRLRRAEARMAKAFVQTDSGAAPADR